MNSALHTTMPSAVAALPSSNPGSTSSLDLPAARFARDGLRSLLGSERNAAAEFLLALAAFDARRGWAVLGHASLFAFLEAELGLSKGATYLRFTAARLLQRFPSVIEPLRDGRLCLSSIGDLSRVATEQNIAEVLPRFFGCSSREAKEVAAALCPREAPPIRDVVTQPAQPSLMPATPANVAVVVLTSSVHAHEPDAPVRVLERREDIEPLSADLRRLHVTVSAGLVKKITAARDSLSHAIPNATTEQVLEAALDLLLEKQARARGQVKRPRATLTAIEPVQRPEAAPNKAAGPDQTVSPPFRHRRAGPRSAIPAEVRRAVWARDGGRCCWPLDGGGTCGSTHRLELDHVMPWAKGGDDSAANLRLTCGRHNALAARAAFGARLAHRYVAPA